MGSTAPDLTKPELDKDYTVSGLIGEDQLTTLPTLTYDPATPDMSKTGDAAAIKADDASAGDNYDITYVAGKLTVTSRPSSGGGGSSTTTKTGTTTNKDGSVTKMGTKSDGTVIETTTNKDGSSTKTETKPDGSSKTEVKDANGSTGTVSTDKNSQTTAEAKVSGKAVSDAKKSDEAVKIPTEVTPGEDSKSAPTVKIDLPGGSVWYEKAQAWAMANGISDGTTPTGTTTRAQMVAMLYRAAGSPEVNSTSSFTDVPADSYYAKAVVWAVQNGITTGVGGGKFNPNGTCTRAQMATFLYRSYQSK